MACIEGGLRFLGSDISTAMLYAGCHWAWVLHMGTGHCPSHPHRWWAEEQAAANGAMLGFRREVIRKGSLDKEAYVDRAIAFLERNLDAGVPCFLWVWEFLLVRGRADDRWELTWPWGGCPGAEDGHSISLRELGELPSDTIYAIHPIERAPAKEIIRESLAFAVHAWSHNKGWAHEVKHVPAAYDNWITGYESGEKIETHDTAYCTAVWAETRRYATEFLVEARKIMSGQATTAFDEAIMHYAEVRDQLARVSELFPQVTAKPGEDIQALREANAHLTRDQDRRDEAAAAVRAAREAEAKGIAAIEQVLKVVA